MINEIFYKCDAATTVTETLIGGIHIVSEIYAGTHMCDNLTSRTSKRQRDDDEDEGALGTLPERYPFWGSFSV